MFIGKLAKATGVSVKSIRFYEEIGLIKTPQREGKYRVYDDSFIQVLSMIKLAKTYGFTLDELKAIARAKSKQGVVPMDLLRQNLDEKRGVIHQQLAELNQKLDGLNTLEQHVAEYNECLLQVLEQDDSLTSTD